MIKFLAVAVVIGLMIGFVTLCVIWTVRVVSQSIRGRSISLLSTYDGLLEDRSRMLRDLNEELERTKASLEKLRETGEAAGEPVAPQAQEGDPMAILKAVERVSGTEYRDKDAGTVYRRIRENFSLDPRRVIFDLALHSGDPEEKQAGKLLEKLNYDTVYRLSTLPGEDQQTLLAEVLEPEERNLLEEYAGLHPRFDCIGFYDFLQSRAAEEPGPIYLRVSPAAAGEAAMRRYPSQVQVVVDDEICEGFQVEADNMLYDYCIKMREMGE